MLGLRSLGEVVCGICAAEIASLPVVPAVSVITLIALVILACEGELRMMRLWLAQEIQIDTDSNTNGRLKASSASD